MRPALPPPCSPDRSPRAAPSDPPRWSTRVVSLDRRCQGPTLSGHVRIVLGSRLRLLCALPLDARAEQRAGGTKSNRLYRGEQPSEPRPCRLGDITLSDHVPNKSGEANQYEESHEQGRTIDRPRSLATHCCGCRLPIYSLLCCHLHLSSARKGRLSGLTAPRVHRGPPARGREDYFPRHRLGRIPPVDLLRSFHSGESEAQRIRNLGMAAQPKVGICANARPIRRAG